MNRRDAGQEPATSQNPIAAGRTAAVRNNAVTASRRQSAAGTVRAVIGGIPTRPTARGWAVEPSLVYCSRMRLHTEGGVPGVADLHEPLSAPTPGEETYAAIRRSILDGTLRPGERIVEQQLAEQLNVSRTPVREALLKLERENLVARIGRGMAVRRYSSDEVRDIYNLRAHLESFAARLAADRITAGELMALTRIQDEMEREHFDTTQAELIRALSRDNQRFHALVVRAARNAPLDRCFVQVFQFPLLYKAYVYFDEERKRRSDRDHRELIEMLRAREGAAAEDHWRSHLRRGGDVLAHHLAAGEAGEL